ncbi:MAG: YkgJ family cysteine cluster protein [Proteobacteria bacterium]|nr:YkgJ family cysteine cluster protein [Pseudomonadota bacterium]
MSTPKEFKAKVLEDAPRFGLSDRFKFGCHPGVSCFNHCCRDINIFLTPYDVLRLKNHLGISSIEFHDKYSVVPFNKEIKQPVPLIRMREEDKSCPFVSDEGCTVYEDRPWACRMYPLGMAAPRDEDQQGDRFYFLMEEEHCHGFKEDTEFSVAEWIGNQKIREYDEAGELFKPITLHPFFESGDMSPAKMDMFFLAAYNLDRFRRFLFESSFLDKFDVEPEVLEAIKEDDYELMKFGFRWLRFTLGFEPTMKMNPSLQEAAQKEKAFFSKGQEES